MVAMEPSGWGITGVSKNDIKPFGLVSSTVNWIQGSIEFMCLQSSFLWADFCTT